MMGILNCEADLRKCQYFFTDAFVFYLCSMMTRSFICRFSKARFREMNVIFIYPLYREEKKEINNLMLEELVHVRRIDFSHGVVSL